jgi:hypothetical protein
MAKTRPIFKILCHVIMVKLDHSFYKALIARMIVTLEVRFAIETERTPSSPDGRSRASLKSMEKLGDNRSPDVACSSAPAIFRIMGISHATAETRGHEGEREFSIQPEGL